MHGVDAVEDRDLEPRAQGRVLVGLVVGGPGLDAVARGRILAAPVQDRAEEVARDVARLLQLGGVGLRHLADLLVERHPREEGVHARVVAGQPRGVGAGRQPPP